MGETTWISKAECSRRLKVSKTMITKYLTRGLPSDESGRVPWPDAEQWVAKNIHPTLSGNFMHREAKKAADCHARAIPAINLSDPYTRGVVDGFKRARRNIREELPAVLGTMALTADARVIFMATLDFLMEVWLDIGPDTDLAPVDWSQFRSESPEKLQALFEESQSILASATN